MNTSQKRFWFPAKIYGYGWGPPSCWQGWAVLIVYFILIGVNASHFLPAKRILAFNAVCVLLTLGLVAICWLKGEKPRWRWGKE